MPDDESDEKLLLEEFPNFHSMTKAEQFEVGHKILDRILVGARKWQDPELNPASAAPLGKAIEKLATSGKELITELKNSTIKH